MRTKKEPKPIKFSQIIVAPWNGDNGLTYSILGLGVDGTLYKYSVADDVWNVLGKGAE